MGLFSTLLIAVALAMDAFAVSLATGIVLCLLSRRQVFRVAAHFGFFQGGMTLLGWGVGYKIQDYVESFGVPLAAGMLMAVGGKMIHEAMEDHPPADKRSDPTKGKTLLILAVATSIDALAVGLSFAVLKQPVLLPALIITVVALIFTVAGLQLGCLLGKNGTLGRRAETLGGVVLLAIAAKILLQHYW